MISSLFNAFIYNPIYNTLAFVVGAIPGGDLGIAIIIVTILVRLIIFPLSAAAARTQIEMQELNPKLSKLRADLKDNKEELAKQTMALFKEHKVNPFSSVGLVIIQIPIILGLYFVFLNEGNAGSFDPALLYSFVSLPDGVSPLFLGVIDLTGKSITLAVLVAASQFVYARLTMPAPAASTGSSFQGDLAKSMHIQMRYVFPLVLGVIAYVITAPVALYFVVSNIFGIAQTYAMKKMHHGQGNNS